MQLLYRLSDTHRRRTLLVLLHAQLLADSDLVLILKLHVVHAAEVGNRCVETLSDKTKAIARLYGVVLRRCTLRRGCALRS